MPPDVCVRHGLMLTRRYSLSTWKPTGEPFCHACERERAARR